MPTRRARPTRSEAPRFGSWLSHLGRQRYAQIAGLATAANLAIALAKSLPRDSRWMRWSSVWFETIQHGLQAFVILILLLALYPRWFARLKDERTDQCRFVVLVQGKFYAYWRLLWFTWFLLYVVLAGFSFATCLRIENRYNSAGKDDDRIQFIKYLKDEVELGPDQVDEQRKIDEKTVRLAIAALEDREKLDDPEARQWLGDLPTILQYQDLVSNFFNNLQTVVFFCCYSVLLCRRDELTGGPTEPPIAYFALGLFLLSFFELIGIIAGVHLHDLGTFRWLSAFAGGVAMALFVGRLESRRFDAPTWLIALLYLYAVAQGAWALEGLTEIRPIVKNAMFSLFLILKLLFFFYVLWALQSGRMLYYIYSLAKVSRRDEATLGLFLRDHVLRPAPGPRGRWGE